MKIRQLIVYPIKSCAPISLESMALGPRGPVLDRHMLLVDAKGVFLTQRQLPRMCLIEVAYEQGSWSVRAPGMGELKLPAPISSYRPSAVWGTPFDAQEFPGAVDEWFSDFLKTPCALLAHGQKTFRPFSHGPGEVSFVDNSPLLVIAQSSLEHLNQRMDTALPMDRFRPSVVIDGVAAYAEDSWQEVQMGEIRLNFVKECTRCVITCTDQKTAKVGPEPLRTLAKYRRRSRDGKIIFGSYFFHQNQGTLNLGDEVRPLSLRSVETQ